MIDVLWFADSICVCWLPFAEAPRWRSHLKIILILTGGTLTQQWCQFYLRSLSLSIWLTH